MKEARDAIVTILLILFVMMVFGVLFGGLVALLVSQAVDGFAKSEFVVDFDASEKVEYVVSGGESLAVEAYSESDGFVLTNLDSGQELTCKDFSDQCQIASDEASQGRWQTNHDAHITVSGQGQLVKVVGPDPMTFADVFQVTFLIFAGICLIVLMIIAN